MNILDAQNFRSKGPFGYGKNSPDNFSPLLSLSPLPTKSLPPCFPFPALLSFPPARLILPDNFWAALTLPKSYPALSGRVRDHLAPPYPLPQPKQQPPQNNYKINRKKKNRRERGVLGLEFHRHTVDPCLNRTLRRLNRILRRWIAPSGAPSLSLSLWKMNGGRRCI